MQGFNMGRYVPPDQEGVISGNKLNKKHALGARASKLASDGILTVRFEMPFAVWCTTCPKPTIIGQGVRFNAQKQRVGSYLSSPIFAFRMRHPPCGGEIEIRTDPQNTAYVVTSGARKRDVGDGAADDSLVKAGGFGEIVTPAERQDQRDSAFANLEKTIADREAAQIGQLRIEELQEAADRAWEDPYERNRRLRDAFRVGRKARERDAAAGEDLKDRMSLGIDLLPASELDARRAALVDFGQASAAEEEGGADGLADKALAKPLFDPASSSAEAKEAKEFAAGEGKKTKKTKRQLKSDVAAAKVRSNFVSEVLGNTRKAQDPFLESWKGKSSPKSPALLLGVKRKRDNDTDPRPADNTASSGAEDISGIEPASPKGEPPGGATTTPGLVSYESD